MPLLPRAATASRPSGLHESEAILATIFAVATPALTVSRVASKTSRRIAAANARASSSVVTPIATKASSIDQALDARASLRKMSKISCEIDRYFCISGGTTISSGQAMRAL